jgi:hypothetical protein
LIDENIKWLREEIFFSAYPLFWLTFSREYKILLGGNADYRILRIMLNYNFHPIIIPIIVALISEASVPAINAGTPYFESSTRLPGANAPIPPICIPMEEKLAKPHKI